jgi:hypothetical protein
MPTLVYSLCFITSGTCAALLLRSYVMTRTRLLLWSAIAFLCLAVNNFFVLLDIVIFPDVNFSPLRYIAALAGVCALLYAFIWESE